MVPEAERFPGLFVVSRGGQKYKEKNSFFRFVQDASRYDGNLTSFEMTGRMESGKTILGQAGEGVMVDVERLVPKETKAPGNSASWSNDPWCLCLFVVKGFNAYNRALCTLCPRVSFTSARTCFVAADQPMSVLP